MMVDELVAVCLTNRPVLDHLAPRLCSDLVMANPFLRRIISFAAAFSTEHRQLPAPGDWGLWVDSLEAGMVRDGTRESLGRVLALDVSTYTPDFVTTEADRTLAQAAVHVARARLNEVSEVSPEAFLALAAQVEAVSHNGSQPADVFPTLQALMQDDALMQTPDELVPRLVWHSTLTVLAGPAFSGKSTLGAQGIAALTRDAPFLDGRHVGIGRALWCNVADEPLGRTVQRLAGFQAHAPKIRLYDFRKPTPDLGATLRRAVEEFTPDAVVIDSLIAWARRTSKETPQSGDAAAWADVMRPLAELAHEQGVGVLVFHHANRRDGHYRDSTEIAAAADVLVEMHLPNANEDPTLRRFVADSRLDGHTTWRASFLDGRYEWGAGGENHDAAATPGEQEGVGGGAVRPGVQDTLDRLPADGASYTDWWHVSTKAQRTFDGHLRTLRTQGLVVQGPDGRYRPTNPGGEA